MDGVKTIKMKNQLLIYTSIIICISWIIQLYVLLNGGIESETFGQLAPIIMFSPSIITIIYLLITKQGLKKINWKIGKPIYLVYAAFIPSFFAFFSALLISVIGWGELAHFNFINNQVDIIKGRFILGRGIQSIPYFSLNFLLTTIIFSLVSGVLAFGEEFAWRGYN